MSTFLTVMKMKLDTKLKGQLWEGIAGEAKVGDDLDRKLPDRGIPAPGTATRYGICHTTMLGTLLRPQA